MYCLFVKFMKSQSSFLGISLFPLFFDTPHEINKIMSAMYNSFVMYVIIELIVIDVM